MVNFLRSILDAWNGLVSFFRLLLPRVFGLRTGGGVRVGSGIEWPLGNVRNIQLENNVSLGKRGWLYLSLDNRQAKIHIGEGTAIGNDFVIAAADSIKVGRGCLIGYRVTLMDYSHITGPGIAPVTSGFVQGRAVSIGEKCFIGCNVVIMPGVKLGENCVVGANSVVTKSFEAGSVIAGAPARFLRKI
jgi:lipopolysaccharide O-acetyltransferase